MTLGHMAVEEFEEDENGQKAPTGRSLFTNPENNMTRKMPTLAYRIVEKQLDGSIKAAGVVWEEIVYITADQAVAAATPSKRKDPSGPMTFLQTILTNGPTPKKVVEERGPSVDSARTNSTGPKRNWESKPSRKPRRTVSGFGASPRMPPRNTSNPMMEAPL